LVVPPTGDILGIMTSELFKHFKPNRDELLQRIFLHVDDGMLEEIAAADYGWKAQECLAALRQIRPRGVVPLPLSSELQEVLELIRWSQPDEANWKPGGSGERGHWMRAFACTAILQVSGDAETHSRFMGGLNQTLIQLIDSLQHAGADLCEHAAALTAWLIIEGAMDPAELAFLGLALLWFTLNQHVPVSDDVVICLAEWIAAQEERGDTQSMGSNRWLSGVTFPEDRYDERWARLGGRLMKLDLGKRSPAAREWVSLIGKALAGEQAHRRKRYSM
jgi:hypothetical protein